MKVFGAGRFAATGLADTDEEGIVCFITSAGFLNGPGFEKMRDDLRRTCSDICVIDCSPEGHQPDVPTRIFQGVQQPVCIVLAARKLGKDDQTPAHVRFRALPKGKREEKFAALEALSLDAKDWIDCPADWRGPFLPEREGKWADFAPLGDLFDYDGSVSCQAGRGSSRRTRRPWNTMGTTDQAKMPRKEAAVSSALAKASGVTIFNEDVTVDLRDTNFGGSSGCRRTERPVGQPTRYAFRVLRPAVDHPRSSR